MLSAKASASEAKNDSPPLNVFAGVQPESEVAIQSLFRPLPRDFPKKALIICYLLGWPGSQPRAHPDSIEVPGDPGF